MTQKELAQKIGVDFRTVSFWETERFEPNIGQIIKLCRLFGVESDYLIGLKNF
ncbi:MAG: helix-turn-helix transcriptional regulator [Clostridia bacterium]|nr:helix-turn-helix transcriptional regulator [Clostridia bacterium]